MIQFGQITLPETLGRLVGGFVFLISHTVAFAGHAEAMRIENFAFGRPLQCASPVLAPGPAFSNAMEKVEAKPVMLDLYWALNAMRVSGFPTEALTAERAIQAAQTTSWLAKRGNIVSAKAHNDLVTSVPGYKGFATSMESFLTVMVQPVDHGTDQDHEDHNHGAAGSGDIDRTSNRLTEVIHRTKTVRKAMGAHYDKPAVRLYLLSHGFKDDVGVLALSHAVCALNLDLESTDKLNVSARFMAMPFKATQLRRSAAAPAAKK